MGEAAKEGPSRKRVYERIRASTHCGPWPPSWCLGRRLRARFFFTGRPCSRGHIDLRSARGKCVVCHTERLRDYRSTPDGALKQAASAKKSARRRAAIDPEWVESERERKRVLQARIREAPDYNERRRVLRRSRRAKESAYMARRRARIYQSSAHHTGEDISRRLQQQKSRCAYCSTKLLRNNYHVDHVMPLSLGGSNGPENIQITCAKCNASKGGLDPIVYARKTGRLI